SRHASTRSSRERIQFPHSSNRCRLFANCPTRRVQYCYTCIRPRLNAEGGGNRAAVRGRHSRTAGESARFGRRVRLQVRIGGYLRQALHPRASTSLASGGVSAPKLAEKRRST